MDPRKLFQLSELTGAAFRAEASKLAKLNQSEMIIKAQISRLMEDRGALAKTERSSTEPALRAGADARWHQWIAARHTRLNAELLQIMTLKRFQMEKVRKANGRSEAMDQLTLRARQAEARDRAARKERDAD